MPRIMMIICLILAGSAFLSWPGMALDHETEKIKETAREIRLNIAELDQQLKEHLRKAIEEYGNRPLECTPGAPRKSLSECIEDEGQDLTQTTITVARSNDRDDDPMGDLADTEERFALFIEKMNKTNDLLAGAGAKLYRSGFDITPEMDQLRRNVIVYVERKQTRDLRTKQAMLIAAVAIILIGIFAVIFAVIRRFR